MKNITPPTEQDTATVKFSWKANSRQARWQRPNNFRADSWQSSPPAPTVKKAPTARTVASETLKTVLWTLTPAQVAATSQEELAEAYRENFGSDGDYYSWLNNLTHRGVFVFSEQEALDIYETAKQEMKDRMNYGE